MFTLLLESATSLLYGFLLSALVVGLMAMVISLLSRKKMQPLTAVVAGIGFVWIWLQSTLMIAAFSVMGYVDNAEAVITILSEDVAQGKTDNIAEALEDEYPVLSIFLEDAKDEVPALQTMSDATTEVSQAVSNTVGSYVDAAKYKVMAVIEYVRGEVSSFIWWRVGFIVIGAILIVPGMMLTMSAASSRSGRYGRGRRDFSADDRALMRRSHASRGSRRSF